MAAPSSDLPPLNDARVLDLARGLQQQILFMTLQDAVSEESKTAELVTKCFVDYLNRYRAIEGFSFLTQCYPYFNEGSLDNLNALVQTYLKENAEKWLIIPVPMKQALDTAMRSPHLVTSHRDIDKSLKAIYDFIYNEVNTNQWSSFKRLFISTLLEIDPQIATNSP